LTDIVDHGTPYSVEVDPNRVSIGDDGGDDDKNKTVSLYEKKKIDTSLRYKDIQN